jgi:hypothetical protein
MKKLLKFSKYYLFFLLLSAIVSACCREREFKLTGKGQYDIIDENSNSIFRTNEVARITGEFVIIFNPRQ